MQLRQFNSLCEGFTRPGAGRVSGSGEVAAFGNVEVTAATMRVGRASLVAQLVKNPPAVRETWEIGRASCRVRV